MNNPLRQTGRTTRMLLEAIKLHEAHRAVYVVAANHNEAMGLRVKLIALCQERLLDPSRVLVNVKVESFGAFPELDWTTMKIRGAHPNVVVLADHHAIEEYYQIPRAPLEMLHRFDAERA